ncbi:MULTISPECIES: hypothetical protein [unclassified Leifsonia]|uniref:hypothetical protein n=1 Tax=unclassified Leifsonia TaxID=2663824 RepID=UPI000364E9E5|nr:MULTISPECIES: hypothetical protein [unclassified Leifsonia]TDQ02169.1 hypothetical protein AXZ95_0438 [Leifsonia sp. 115AMFTsu3.1]
MTSTEQHAPPVQKPAPAGPRSGFTRIVIASAAGVVVFAAGAGASGAVAMNSQRTVENTFVAAKKKAVALYEDDRAAQKKLATKQKEVEAARGALTQLQRLLEGSEAVSDTTREHLDDALDELTSYDPEATPADAVPRPQPKDAAGMWIGDLSAEAHRLVEFSLDHEEDHEATERAVDYLEETLADAKQVAQEIIAESWSAGLNLPGA